MTGTLVDDQGTPLQGAVTLTPSRNQVVSPTTDRVIHLQPRIIQLSQSGGFTADLIPSNESDITEKGVLWYLTLPNEPAPVLSFFVPNDVSTADISQCVVANPGPGEPTYLIGYRGPKGDEGEQGLPGPAGYDDAPLTARVVALETAGFLRRIIYTGFAYPARPAGVSAGYVEYVGPVQPTDWLTGDTWVEQV